jgi:hypothetical protein
MQELHSPFFLWLSRPQNRGFFIGAFPLLKTAKKPENPRLPDKKQAPLCDTASYHNCGACLGLPWLLTSFFPFYIRYNDRRCNLAVLLEFRSLNFHKKTTELFGGHPICRLQV